MNESCPPREREGTVVYTAEYGLMFSYGEGGNAGEMEGEAEPEDGRNEGETDDGGKGGCGRTAQREIKDKLNYVDGNYIIFH